MGLPVRVGERQIALKEYETAPLSVQLDQLHQNRLKKKH